MNLLIQIKNIRVCLSCAFVGVVIFVFGACSNTKHLPAGDKLYIGSEVTLRPEPKTLTLKQQVALQDELNALTRPKPNTKFLWARSKLFAYNFAGTPKKKGLRYLIRTQLG